MDIAAELDAIVNQNIEGEEGKNGKGDRPYSNRIENWKIGKKNCNHLLMYAYIKHSCFLLFHFSRRTTLPVRQ